MDKIYKALGPTIYCMVALIFAGIGAIEICDGNDVIAVVLNIIAFGMIIWLTRKIKILEHENFKLECWCEHIQETINRDMEV